MTTTTIPTPTPMRAAFDKAIAMVVGLGKTHEALREDVLASAYELTRLAGYVRDTSAGPLSAVEIATGIDTIVDGLLDSVDRKLDANGEVVR